MRTHRGALPGVECVLDRAEQHALALDHPRSGELVALARPDAWFTYYYWLDDRRAPDFARLVEIHRKPGYDPVELFLDPAIRFPKLAVGWRLALRALGFRTADGRHPARCRLVKGSHGRPTDNAADGPMFMSSEAALLPDGADRRHRRQGHRSSLMFSIEARGITVAFGCHTISRYNSILSC